MAESSLRLTQRRWSWRRRSWLGVTAVLVGAGLLTIYAAYPVLASCLIIVAIGYTLQFAGANLPGVFVWIAAAAMLSAALWTTSRSIFPPDFFLAFGGFSFSLPAGVAFLVASIKNRGRCAANFAGCMLVLFTVLIYWFPGGTLKTYRQCRDASRETRQKILVLHCLAGDIEAIRARLGRVPNDEAELVALPGKPMPHHVLYVNQGKSNFVLTVWVPQAWGWWDMLAGDWTSLVQTMCRGFGFRMPSDATE